jgi:hypothetical protein
VGPISPILDCLERTLTGILKIVKNVVEMLHGLFLKQADGANHAADAAGSKGTARETNQEDLVGGAITILHVVVYEKGVALADVLGQAAGEAAAEELVGDVPGATTDAGVIVYHLRVQRTALGRDGSGEAGDVCWDLRVTFVEGVEGVSLPAIVAVLRGNKHGS